MSAAPLGSPPPLHRKPGTFTELLAQLQDIAHTQPQPIGVSVRQALAGDFPQLFPDAVPSIPVGASITVVLLAPNERTRVWLGASGFASADINDEQGADLRTPFELLFDRQLHQQVQAGGVLGESSLTELDAISAAVQKYGFKVVGPIHRHEGCDRCGHPAQPHQVPAADGLRHSRLDVHGDSAYGVVPAIQDGVATVRQSPQAVGHEPTHDAAAVSVHPCLPVARTVILHGPQGCGKSTHASTFCGLFGTSLVVEEWWDGQPICPGALHLTDSTARKTSSDCLVVSFDDALAMAAARAT